MTTLPEHMSLTAQIAFWSAAFGMNKKDVKREFIPSPSKPWIGGIILRQLETDIYAFKKVVDYKGYPAIANLIIYKGTWVAAGIGKCRAEKVKVHSIIRCKDKKSLSCAYGPLYSEFKYNKGRVALPSNGFYRQPMQYGAGIHFFIDLQAALNY